ncbi:hypothetical protein [Pontimicrobium sp. SW4]|uniref:Rieske domain-containing protein n=1 Tax=Pontimicrobium sp. SW4 TaxID=3153519 RepID=A0AAU7BSP8_9FLAO
MKKLILSLLFPLLLVSCSKSDINNRNCRFLLNIGVNTSINLNLPQYSSLQFVSNSVFVPNVGNGGLIVTNSGTGFLAWDASDPNHTPSSCSKLEVNGLEGTCGCSDANVYSLITGQPLSDPNLNCGLKAYRVEQSGNDLIINN